MAPPAQRQLGGPSPLQLAGWASTAAFAVLVAGLWQLLVTMPAERNPCGMTWNFVSYSPVEVEMGVASSAVAAVGGGATSGTGHPAGRASVPASASASKYVLYKAINNYPGRRVAESSKFSAATPGALPVLYIPGHGGSFQQARSLAAQLDGVRAPHEFDPRDPQYARDVARGARKARPRPRPRRLRVRRRRRSRRQGRGGGGKESEGEEEEEALEEVALPPCDVFTIDFNGGELSGLSGAIARAQASFVADAIATIAKLYEGEEGGEVS